MSYRYDRWDNLGWISIAGTLLLLAVLLVYVIAKSIAADGRSDYCYIEHQVGGIGAPDYIRLVAHIPWRSDRHLGNFKDVVEATTAAKIAGCPEVR